MKNNTFYKSIKGHRAFRMLRVFFFIGTIVFLAWYVSAYWYQLMLIQGESMAPTYHSFQIVVLDKHNEEFERGDVIAFYCKGLSCVLVKRLVALPGDEVEISNGKLYINGELSSIYKGSIFEYAGELEDCIYLNSGEYIAIGDNVEESKDSRYNEVGRINKKDIIGKVYPSSGH